MISLPIDSAIDEIRAALDEHQAVVVTARPGAGKTTRVPPALLDAGSAILLQPRRVAVRAIAARIASERGWTVGREVGWQVRLERRFSADTRLLVVTEGILTARLQGDPLLSRFSTIVIDEFHERSVHADLALALSVQAWRARGDLRIVVMSATLDADPVSRFLDDCPIVDVPGQFHPIDIAHAPGESAAIAATRIAPQTDGDLLCFEPGAGEIRRTVSELESRLPRAIVEVVPLHGSLGSDDQMRALAPSPTGVQRIVVATNIAETSLTVPGVRAVIDSGLQKVARYDAGRGIDSLVTERITQDSADQRAGRAGRTGGGQVVRLWDTRDRLRPRREAEIHHIDLAGAVLDILAWGGHPDRLEWFERPAADKVEPALTLLRRLGAESNGHITRLGRQMQRLPLNPRLSRMLIEAAGAWTMVQACALLSERSYLAPRGEATTADLLSAIDDWASSPAHVRLVAAELERILRTAGFGTERRVALEDAAFRRSLLAGYPDRVAHRREPGSSRLKLSTGAGAVLGHESGVVDAEFLLAIDVRGAASAAKPGSGPQSSQTPEGVVRIAARLEADWLSSTRSEIRCWFDDAQGIVRAAATEYYDALVLRETPAPAADEAATALLTEAWLRRGPREAEAQLLNRLKFAGDEPDVEGLVRRAAHGHRALGDVDIVSSLDRAQLNALDRDAPLMLRVPSGRLVPLDYRADATVRASVKLQELFGLAETPRIGRRQEPVLLSLLAPNGRPVQITRDLKSFWSRTYPEIRRELRGRYPRHPWPEDP